MGKYGLIIPGPGTTKGKNIRIPRFFVVVLPTLVRCGIIPIEYHSVCPGADPSSELGPPTPCDASEFVHPPRNQRGGNTRLRVRGWADPIRTTGEKAWHCIYSVL
jgi:hypothetical protein